MTGEVEPRYPTFFYIFESNSNQDIIFFFVETNEEEVNFGKKVLQIFQEVSY